jgi:dienelactone hydrolase
VPEGDVKNAPAVLFLHGAVTYVFPESLWWDIRDLISKNSTAREKFVIVAPLAAVGEPIAVVSQTRTKRDRFGNTIAYTDDFDEVRAWGAFIAVLTSLGSDMVDMSRLSVMGFSMGGQGSWNLACLYGSRLAAVVPFAGKCSWHKDAGIRGNETRLLAELQKVALRAYHGQDDPGTYSWRDFGWLAWCRGLPDKAEQLEETIDGQGLEVSVYQWRSQEGKAELRLSLLRGLYSAHCCWESVLHNEDDFGLFAWLQTQECNTPLNLKDGPGPIFPASTDPASV